MNPYEAAARSAKVTRLLDALDAVIGHPITEAEADQLDVPTLKKALSRAGIQEASEKTINALVARIRERDERTQR